MDSLIERVKRMVIHNKSQVNVSFDNFSKRSSRFSVAHLDIASQEIDVIESPFDDETFEVYCAACEGMDNVISRENVFLVLSCSYYFGNTILQQNATNFIFKNYRPTEIIATFNDFRKKDFPYMKGFYILFAGKIEEFLGDPEFIKINVCDLIKIFKRVKIEEEIEPEITTFILSHLRTNKNPEVIKCISFNQSSNAQLSQIAEVLNNIGYQGHSALVKRIATLKSNSSKEKSSEYTVKIEYKGLPFKGIFDAIKRFKKSRNLITDGIINFSSSSNNSISLFEPLSGHFWATGNEPNSSLTIFLKSRKVRVTGYRLRSATSCFPRTFKLEASEDGGLTWKTLDCQTNYENLSIQYAMVAFTIVEPPDIYFNAIRLTQTAPNATGTNTFALRNFDIFGTLDNGKDFPFNETSFFAPAVLNSLMKPCQVIAIASSNSPHYLLEPMTDVTWGAAPSASSFLAFDFGVYRTKITGYSIKTHSGRTGSNHLRSWALEGSVDGESWDEIDRRDLCEDLNAPSVFAYFEVPTALQEDAEPWIKYVRLRLTGPNCAEKNIILLDSIELFGEVLIPLKN